MRYPLTPWLLATLLLAAPLQALDRYDLKVQLDPARHSLEVTAALTAQTHREATRELSWRLLGELKLDRLQGPQVADWQVLPAAQAGAPATLKVRLKQPLPAGQAVRLRLHYQGALPQRITPEWTELGQGLAWYPQRSDRAPFTFKLTVRCGPEFALASYGPFQGSWSRVLAWSQPVADLVLVATPKDRLHAWNPAPRVRLLVTDLPEAAAARLATAMGGLMGHLQRRLGPREGAAMTLLQSPRRDSAGYGGGGLLVQDGLGEARDPEEVLLRLARDTAQLWWQAAPATTWEDWLNQSFTEYSAQVALRDLLGEPAYQRRIELKRRACEGLPPLWQFDRAGKDALPLMANKGVVLLAELEEFVGRERFASLCRELAEQRVSRTQQFLDLLEARAGKPVREAFQRRIMAL